MSEKSILALVGTKRKQSTYKVLKMFESALKKHNFTMEYAFLYKVALCSGCLRCVEKGIETCPYYEDIREIIDKISKADVIFFATPVYVDALSGILKNLIDRLVYFVHRPWLFDKRSILIATTQYSGGKETLDYVDKIARRWGSYPIDRLVVKMALFDKNKEEVIKEIEQISKKLNTELQKKKKPSPSLYELTYFRIMRILVNLTKKEVPLDYEYWKNKGWFETDFYCDAKISIISNLLAKRIEKRVQKALNKS